MTRTGLIVLSCVLVVLALGTAMFLQTFERKETSSLTVAHGEARYNRFFALELTLRQLHVPVSSVTMLSPTNLPLQPDDILVLGEGLSRIDAGQAQQLAAWVSRGGYLVLSPGNGEVAAHTPLFEQIKLLRPDDAGSGCVEMTSALAAGKDEDGAFRLCGKFFRPLTMAAADAWVGNQSSGYAFVRTLYGAGRVGLLNDMDVLSYNSLRHPAQQQFARRLLLQPGSRIGHVYLVYTLDGPSLWTKLITRGWPALLASILLLLGWSLRRSERLGPLIPAPPPQRRALLEHVQAVGEYLFRRDRGHSLHAIACRVALARLRRRDPLCAALEGDALHQRIAERYRLEPAQLAQAFQPPANAMAFRESLAILARLRSRP